MSSASSFAAPQNAALRGIILRDEGDALIVQASPADVERFGARHGTEVSVRRATVHINLGSGGTSVAPDVHTANADIPRFAAIPPVLDIRDGYLYDRHGSRVALITDVRHRVDPIDITTFGDVARQFIDGYATTTITAEILTGVEIRT